jgi:hypothetical protein
MSLNRLLTPSSPLLHGLGACRACACACACALPLRALNSRRAALRLQFHALSLKFSANPEALSKEVGWLRVRLLSPCGPSHKHFARVQFEVSATLYSGGASFHPHVSNSLFNILLGDVRKFGSRERLETALTISFSPEIINPTIWRALFRCLARSRLEYRTAALNDVTTVIINSHANVK